jgi:hypothetical protein
MPHKPIFKCGPPQPAFYLCSQCASSKLMGIKTITSATFRRVDRITYKCADCGFEKADTVARSKL